MDPKPSKGGLAEEPDERKEAGSTSTRVPDVEPGAVELSFSGADLFTPAMNTSQGVKPLEHKDDENPTESDASEGNRTSAGSDKSESGESVQDILDQLGGNPGPRTQRLANVRARMELEAEQHRELKKQLGRTIARQDSMDRNQEQMGENLQTIMTMLKERDQQIQQLMQALNTLSTDPSISPGTPQKKSPSALANRGEQADKSQFDPSGGNTGNKGNSAQEEVSESENQPSESDTRDSSDSEDSESDGKDTEKEPSKDKKKREEEPVKVETETQKALRKLAADRTQKLTDENKGVIVITDKAGKLKFQGGQFYPNAKKGPGLPLRPENIREATTGYLQVKLTNLIKTTGYVNPRTAIALSFDRLETLIKFKDNKNVKQVLELLKGVVSAAFGVPGYERSEDLPEKHWLEKRFTDAQKLLTFVYRTEGGKKADNSFLSLFEEEGINEILGVYCYSDKGRSRQRQSELQEEYKRLLKKILKVIRCYKKATKKQGIYHVDPILSNYLKALKPRLRALGRCNEQVSQSTVATGEALEERVTEAIAQQLNTSFQSGVLSELSEGEYKILKGSVSIFRKETKKGKSGLQILVELDKKLKMDQDQASVEGPRNNGGKPTHTSDEGNLSSSDESESGGQVKSKQSKKKQRDKRAKTRKKRSVPILHNLAGRFQNDRTGKMEPVLRRLTRAGGLGEEGQGAIKQLHDVVVTDNQLNTKKGRPYKKLVKSLLATLHSISVDPRASMPEKFTKRLVKDRKLLAADNAAFHARRDGWTFDPTKGNIDAYTHRYRKTVKELNKRFRNTGDDNYPYQGNISKDEFQALTSEQKSVLKVLRLFYNRSREGLTKLFRPGKKSYPHLNAIAQHLKLTKCTFASPKSSAGGKETSKNDFEDAFGQDVSSDSSGPEFGMEASSDSDDS